LSFAESHPFFLAEIKSHITVPVESKYSVSQYVRKQFSNLFSSYSQAFNKQQKRIGNLFMSNFKRRRIETDEDLTNIIKYIHLNPVSHGIVENIAQWKFSSYNMLCSNEQTFLAKEKVIQWFGNVEEFKNFRLRGGENFPKFSAPENFPKV
jgi:hypothetical protein